MTAQAGFEGVVDGRAVHAIRRDEHRVPAARPTETGRSALHVGATLGHAGIVRRGDRAALRTEGLRRIAASGLDVLGVHPTESRQWVADLVDLRSPVQQYVLDGIRTYVA